ncbi:hypothetical protein F5B22DRAFT_637449 [Xylaria bambusicola]|uniref:uncharacterized protein n=1 Tax=Xylaria bambusicola TaxID=326684 RepID=UPI0020089705|nr:uncharacterized protein F5B22DRAFT_637449 [Xylaria bambusicola]KAI0512842.1 hypothetical protein F5B22DRAFT_637449 [Xylaria bambusicola]
MSQPTQSRRPRLTLQTRPVHGSGVKSRHTYANVDIKSPTALNTLSNVYATAIERSTPTQTTPLTAVKLHPPLKLRTDVDTLRSHQQRVRISSAPRPDTPLSDNATSPLQKMEVVCPSTMTPTPPLSAEPVDSERRAFTFPSMEIDRHIVPLSPGLPRRSNTTLGFGSLATAPYSHNRSLHSILRNSPLQPFTAKSPSATRRKSVRLQERVSRRVGYESPLTKIITTEKYTKSHIDLLAEEASPYTPSPRPEDSDRVIDLAMAYPGDETKDGGQTPGPFEEMRRRMTSLATETPVRSPRSGSDGVHKRKRKEKRRKWVWTIGKEDEESGSGEIAAVRATGEAFTFGATRATLPVPVRIDRSETPEPVTAIKTSAEWSESISDTSTETEWDCMDVDIAETSSLHPSEITSHGVDLDIQTLVATHDLDSPELFSAKRQRLDHDVTIPPTPVESSEVFGVR